MARHETRNPSRLTPIAIALLLASTGANASITFATRSAQSIGAAGAYAATVVAQNCNDSGAGSLRQAVVSAGNGGSVDLSQLACSKITLGSEIAVLQDSLTIYGPSQSGLSISGNHNSRVFKHTGTGGLVISDLTIADGNLFVSGYAKGGCIYSKGSVALLHATVTGCTATGAGGAYGANGAAFGGGVYAHGATVKYSIVEGNKAAAPWVRGGGLSTATFFVSRFSSFENNTAISGSNLSGGGISADSLTGTCYIGNTLVRQNSAISDPQFAAGGAGVYLNSDGPTCTIVNSTISNNSCQGGSCFGGGIEAYGASMSIFNSTITGNLADSGGGVDVCLHPGATLQIVSTIIAANSGFTKDLGLGCPTLVSGANNDIVDSEAPIAGDLTVDPKLGPIQDNGGLTKTMLPMKGSPVIGKGSNSQNFRFDQRGRGHPRMTGNSVDIGAAQFDTIFADGLEP